MGKPAIIDYKDVSTGHGIHGSPTTTLSPGTNGESAHQDAPPTLASGTEIFLFWNPPGGPVTTAKSITMRLFPGSEATAWYGRKGPGEIVARSFSDGENKFLLQTPIASVVPASSWSGGNSENVSNSTSVTITAKDSIAGDSADSGETFDGWLQFENGVVSGATLTVPAGESCYAIAFYRNQKLPKLYPKAVPKLVFTALLPARVAPGVPVDGAGEPQPPEPWASMAPADHDLLVGLSVNEIGSMINDAGARASLKKLGLELAQKALTRIDAEEPQK
jgi:hypothetical protein